MRTWSSWVMLAFLIVWGGGCDGGTDDAGSRGPAPSELEQLVYGQGAEMSNRAKQFDSAWKSLSAADLRAEWFVVEKADSIAEKLRKIESELGWEGGRPDSKQVSNQSFKRGERLGGSSTHALKSEAAEQLIVSWEFVGDEWRISDLAVK